MHHSYVKETTYILATPLMLNILTFAKVFIFVSCFYSIVIWSLYYYRCIIAFKDMFKSFW
jgi:hypothetical protein